MNTESIPGYTRLDWSVETRTQHDEVASTLAYSGWKFHFTLGRCHSGEGRSLWTKGTVAYVVTEMGA